MKCSGLAALLIALLATGARAQDLEPIVAEVTVEAPVASVWAAWTTGAGLRSWLAPHADIELGIGERMRANYDPQGTLGDARTIENSILAYDPLRMLTLRVSRAPEGLPFPDAIHRMWTVIYFDAVEPERTRVRVVGLGFEADEESQRMRAFFERGNEMTLRLLQSHFARP
jgi:uncharacterized protein YndB with AHSA1/START domain